MYDFLLFENYHLATHHLYDVFLIARMMKSQGMSVAVFDIYSEMAEDEIDGIPVIHWNPKQMVPNDTWMLRKHSVLETMFKSFCLFVQKHFFFKEVVRFIYGKSKAFYCGSYQNGISTQLFKISKPCYYWGLRSDRLAFSWRKFFPSLLSGVHLLMERKRFLNNSSQRLFVSNPIILKEHESLGIPRNRMVIREERVVEEQIGSDLDSLDNNISFLVIGQLRHEKHVPSTIDAFKKADIPRATLKLIGRSSQGYEDVINASIDGDERIIRNNAFLNYDDFYRYFSQSHFVLFADQEGRSCITNGTMMEALIHHRPIICPDYNPYKYYIEKYGVGLLYSANDISSYADALKLAAGFGVSHFEKNISCFLNTLQFDIVAKQFVEDIKDQIS